MLSMGKPSKSVRLKVVARALAADWSSVPLLLYWGVLLATVALSWRDYGAPFAFKWFAMSFLAFWAGSGFRGSLYWSWGAIAYGGVMAALFVALALWLSEGLAIHLKQGDVAGWQWVVGTFVLFFALTPKRFAMD